MPCSEFIKKKGSWLCIQGKSGFFPSVMNNCMIVYTIHISTCNSVLVGFCIFHLLVSLELWILC